MNISKFNLDISDWLNLIAISITLIGIVIRFIQTLPKLRASVRRTLSKEGSDNLKINTLVIALYLCCTAIITFNFFQVSNLIVLMMAVFQFLLVSWMHKIFTTKLKQVSKLEKEYPYRSALGRKKSKIIHRKD